MKEFAMDWGGNEKKLVVFDGKNVVPDTTNMLSFVRDNPGVRIFVETPFEPWHRETRNLVIDEAERLGVELLTFNPRLTGLWRREHKLDKSDTVDAQVIWDVAHAPNTVLAKARKIPPRESTPIEDMQVARRRGWPQEDSDKFLQYVPVPADAPADVQEMLCNGKEYAETYVCAVVAAAMQTINEGRGRKRFDQLLGMNAHGYPSLLRALTYCKGMCPGRVQALLQRSHEKAALKRMSRQEVTALMQPIRRKLRRACRWVFHQVKDRYKTSKTDLNKPTTGHSESSSTKLARASTSLPLACVYPASVTLVKEPLTPLDLVMRELRESGLRA